MRWMLCSIVVAAAACGDNASAGLDAATGPDAHFGFVEAMHPAQPQVHAGSGSVLTAPSVVPIFFAGDDAAQATIEQFLVQLAADPVYWPATTAEYGIGPLVVAPSIVTTQAPPTTDAELQTFLSSNIGAGLPFGALDPQAIYTVFLPEGAVLNSGGVSCKAFGGYHSEIASASAGTPSTVYALIPRCHVPQIDQTPLDETTVATSHELVEAASDPHFFTSPGFRFLDNDDLVDGRTPGGELGDMCEYLRSASVRIIGNGTFLVQRTWSNVSAAAGHDPCVPAPATPYVGAAPVFTDDIPFGRNGTTTKGVTIAVGASVTLEVDLFSDAELPVDYDVEAQDAATLAGGQSALTFQWSQTHGNNGDKLQLIVTRDFAATRGSELVIWTLVKNRYVGMWWGLVAD